MQFRLARRARRWPPACGHRLRESLVLIGQQTEHVVSFCVGGIASRHPAGMRGAGSSCPPHRAGAIRRRRLRAIRPTSIRYAASTVRGRAQLHREVAQCYALTQLRHVAWPSAVRSDAAAIGTCYVWLDVMDDPIVQADCVEDAGAETADAWTAQPGRRPGRPATAPRLSWCRHCAGTDPARCPRCHRRPRSSLRLA